jgi:hypothetical protein
MASIPKHVRVGSVGAVYKKNHLSITCYFSRDIAIFWSMPLFIGLRQNEEACKLITIRSCANVFSRSPVSQAESWIPNGVDISDLVLES